MLGAQVLGEFRGDPNRSTDAKSRRNYAGTSLLTIASGRKRAVLARHIRNRRLYDAIDRWAFCAISTSPGARAFYDQHRAAGDTHHQAFRALGNRLVGILHGCLRQQTLNDEHSLGPPDGRRLMTIYEPGKSGPAVSAARVDPIRLANPQRHTLAAMLYDMPRRAVRVVILGINYAPEPTGIAPYTTGLAMGLAKRGHEVLVLTGYPHYPQWKRDEASSRFRSEDQLDGVRVRRLSHRVPRRLSWIGRAAMELTFGLQLITTGWGRPEVLVVPQWARAMWLLRVRESSRNGRLGS